MSKTDLGEVQLSQYAKQQIALKQREDAFNSLIQSLDGKPAGRVHDILRNSSTVSLETIKQLMELDVWPSIHRLINNQAHDRIIGCIINEDRGGELALSEYGEDTVNVRFITFDATSIKSDETRYVRPPGKQIDGPRPPELGIDDMDDKSQGTSEPLQF